jgi:hypothetical protein
LLLFTGCTRVIDVPTDVVEGYPQRDMIDLKVALRITDQLRNAKWEKRLAGKTFIVPMGKAFPQNAEAVARRIFRDVVVENSETGPAEPDVDAILIPTLVSFEETVNEGLTSIVFRWTLKDLNGSVIWEDTIRGGNVALDGASIFSKRKERRSKNLNTIIETTFKRSFHAISSSSEIREFAATLNK